MQMQYSPTRKAFTKNINFPALLITQPFLHSSWLITAIQSKQFSMFMHQGWKMYSGAIIA